VVPRRSGDSSRHPAATTVSTATAEAGVRARLSPLPGLAPHPLLAQQRGDSDDGSPSGTNVETPSGEDFSLSLADTNLPSEVEPELRSFIAKRLSKGAVFEGLGNVASVELRIPGYRVGCYYCLFQQVKLLPETATAGSEQNPSEYVVCFLGGSEKGLELELDKYIQGLKNSMNCESY
uniref:Chromosome 17 open reading frame 75 n=1 Tax=Cavia porcellus TaxID=10141 RepID=A0A286XAP0_CAVPO